MYDTEWFIFINIAVFFTEYMEFLESQCFCKSRAQQNNTSQIVYCPVMPMDWPDHEPKVRHFNINNKTFTYA